ncbi:MAG: LysM peptidoglycan-binding domain-containing protein [Clostridia bacterium]|nr:LysM peptidoglycan-binding domain-containing protein [Clostridia bacterium]
MHQNPCTQCPQNKVCGYEYTVRRGDSFYLIANRLGVPLRDLLDANPDMNPARLMVGDVLCIPMEEDDAPSTPAPTSPAEEAPDDLDTPATPADEPASPQDAPMDDAIRVCPESSRYTVQPGETAADVLLRANLNLHTLQAANPDADLTSLTEGQVLCVPEESIPCPVRPTYILQTDETLESAALRLNASLSALLHANPCLAPGDFKAGVCIYIPED